MATSYQRIALSDSIGLHQIIDPKFKTNTLKVRFLLPLHPAHAAAHALAGSLLTTSCQISGHHYKPVHRSAIMHTTTAHYGRTVDRFIMMT